MIATIEDIRSLDPRLVIVDFDTLASMIGYEEVKRVVDETKNFIRTVTGINAVFVGGYVATMTPEYAERRGWDTWMAVREFIQNAADASELMFGVVTVGSDVVVYDVGGGVAPSSILYLGASDKQCWQRGMFGEGAKIGMLQLEYRGYPTLVITNYYGYNLVYRFVPTRDRKSLVFLVFSGDGIMRRIEDEVVGSLINTAVYIVGVKDQLLSDISKYTYGRRDISLAYLGPEEADAKCVRFGTFGCDYDARNCVLLGDRRGLLYVRDILVNTMDKIYRKSIFGYNLWWVDLDPNRTNVRDMYQFREEVARVLEKVVIDNDRLLNELIDELVNMRTDVVGGVLKVYKVSLDSSYIEEEAVSNSDVIQEVMIERIVNDLIEKGETVISVDTEVPVELMARVAHGVGGGAVVVVPDSMRSGVIRVLRKLGLKSLRELYVESVEKMLEGRASSHECAELLSKLARQFAELVLTRLTFTKPEPEVIVTTTGRSHVLAPNSQSPKIVISDSVFMQGMTAILRTIIHEVAHIVAYHVYGKGEDLTEQHVMALEKVSSLAFIEPEVLVAGKMLAGLAKKMMVVRIGEYFDFLNADLLCYTGEVIRKTIYHGTYMYDIEVPVLPYSPGIILVYYDSNIYTNLMQPIGMFLVDNRVVSDWVLAFARWERSSIDDELPLVLSPLVSARRNSWREVRDDWAYTNVYYSLVVEALLYAIDSIENIERIGVGPTAVPNVTGGLKKMYEYAIEYAEMYKLVTGREPTDVVRLAERVRRWVEG